MAWEVVQEVRLVLGMGMFATLETPFMPANFRHWREKYCNEPL
jgi:hypothetical protein